MDCNLMRTYWFILRFKKKVDGPVGDRKHQKEFFQASACPCVVSCIEKIESDTNKKEVGSDFGKWEKRKKILNHNEEA